MASCATRPKAPRRAVSHLASRTSSSTTCWTNGSGARCGHSLQADVPLSASLMILAFEDVLEPSREDLAEMAVAAGSREPAPLAPAHRTPQALPSASASNCPLLHHHERGSSMKNRKREICTSGSVRDEDGQPPHLLGRRTYLHLAAGAAVLPAVRPQEVAALRRQTPKLCRGRSRGSIRHQRDLPLQPELHAALLLRASADGRAWLWHGLGRGWQGTFGPSY